MMNPRFLLVVLAIPVFIACKKEKEVTNPTIPPPPAALLKEIAIPHLPSPYYHFEYDAGGNVTFVSFASDFTRYNVTYDAGRIREMRSNILVNKDILQYFYNNSGDVISIHYADSTGIVYTKIDFSYKNGKLVKLERAKKSGTDFMYDKRSEMSYYEDGNLKDITYHYLPFNGQPESFNTVHFEQYDNNINVDSYGLIHNEFTDHFFLLPGVQLQENNPGKETSTGDGTNYIVNYTYTYNEKDVPVNKKGDLLITSGPDAGERFETNSFYSYY